MLQSLESFASNDKNCGGSISPRAGSDISEKQLEKRRHQFKTRKTISKVYLSKFTSLRDLAQPKKNEDDSRTAESCDEPAERGVGMFVAETVKITANSDRRKVFLFNLSMFERIFLTFHRPSSSKLSKVLSYFMMVVIIISCVFFVIATDPHLKSIPSSCKDPACDNDPVLCPGQTLCEPVEPVWFFSVELTCIIIFTVDYVTRMCLVAFVPPRLSNILPRYFDIEYIDDLYKLDPVYSKIKKLILYFFDPMNVIDLVAILPFYVGLLTDTQSSVSVIRILRLGRMIRVFKVGKYNVGSRLIAQTVRESIPALSLLMFFTLLLVVLFGSLVFFAEGGVYTISPDYPDGAYLRTNLLANGKEESPFLSIVVSCWWVVVTMTTVGYGDIYPTTPFGRLIGMICMLVGILALALPIGVMGSSFNRNYAIFHGKGENGSDASQNVQDLDSSEIVLSDEIILYELNNEVVVRAQSNEDGSADFVECDDDSHIGDIGMTSFMSVNALEDEMSDDNSPQNDENAPVEESHKSDLVIHGEETKMSEHSKEDVISDDSARDRKTNPVSLTYPFDEKSKSSALSKGDIRKRLEVLSCEIQFLIKALESNESD